MPAKCKLGFHLLAALLTVFAVPVSAADFGNHPNAEAFIARMTDHGFSPDETLNILNKAENSLDALRLIARPVEIRLTWSSYRERFISDNRVAQGAVFGRTHMNVLKRAEETYAVPIYIILGILGVETSFGSNTGSHNVLDVLTTLAFNYKPRSRFFTDELASFLIMAHKQKADPTSFQGSYAGAMGLSQFMPSSFLNFAVDFDGDGKIDLLNSAPDAIGSIANYLKQNGWRPRGEVMVPALLLSESDKMDALLTLEQISWLGIVPQQPLPIEEAGRPIILRSQDRVEYWIGLKNFWVITSYNPNQMYAAVAYHLGKRIEQAINQPTILPEEDIEDEDWLEEGDEEEMVTEDNTEETEQPNQETTDVPTAP